MNEIDDNENTSLEKVEESGGWLRFIVFFCIGAALSFGTPKLFELYKTYKAEQQPVGGELKICRFNLDGEGGYFERQCRVVGSYAYINDGVQMGEK